MKFSVVTPLWQDRPATENMQVAINADRLGFGELWVGEMATYDAFAFATAAGINTGQISLNIGPLAVSVRTPMTMAMGVASVAELTGRQTNLALGASSIVVVQEWHGRQRERTAQHLQETAGIVRGLLRGEKVNYSGELASCEGYRLRLDPTNSDIIIAAFGPAAIRTAARHADRLLLNMVTPASVVNIKARLEEAAGEAARPPPGVSAWVTCAVDPGRESLDQIRRAVVGYLAAPGYSEMLGEAGFAELVAFAKTRPHPKELLALLPDELIRAIGLVGSADEIAERVEAYRAAGVDEICLVPATAGDPGGLKTLTAMQGLLASH